MPTWNKLHQQVRAAPNPYDVIRRKWLRKLHAHTGRNVIIYYSGWLQKSELQRHGLSGFEVNDSDKNGFMAAIHGLDRKKGLDLLLHTPGGSVSATESLVDYLRSMFGRDVRAIVPQLAMSAGTMISLSCREVVMGKHSSLGPIDPQMGGLPAHGVVEEFERAAKEIARDPSRIPLWQMIIAKYPPTFIGECEKAIDWSGDIVEKWLQTGMFHGEPDAKQKAQRISKELSDHSKHKSHSRQLSAQAAKDLGIKVSMLEDDQDLQDAVLTVHHACIQTLADTPAFKLIENHKGVASVLQAQIVNPKLNQQP